MGVHVERTGRRRSGLGLGDEVEHAVRRDIQRLRVERAILHGGDELRVGASARRRHFEVEACGQPHDTVVDGAPVAHDEPFEAPVVAQHLSEEPRVLRRVDAVDLVVGAHDRPGLRVPHDPFEAAQVDLAQRPRVDIGRHPHPVVLLVVRREVLERRADALRLDAGDEGHPERTRHDRVLREVLEVASAQRRALDVDARPEDDGDVLDRRLDAERLPDALGEREVPRRAEADGGREAGGGNGVREPQVVGRPRLLAQTVRAVGHHDRRYADAVDRLGRPEVAPARERRLLFEGEVGCRDVGHVIPFVEVWRRRAQRTLLIGQIARAPRMPRTIATGNSPA